MTVTRHRVAASSRINLDVDMAIRPTLDGRHPVVTSRAEYEPTASVGGVVHCQLRLGNSHLNTLASQASNAKT